MQSYEGISEGFRLKSLIGKHALLQLLTATSGDQRRPFHAVEVSGADSGLPRYQLTLKKI